MLVLRSEVGKPDRLPFASIDISAAVQCADHFDLALFLQSLFSLAPDVPEVVTRLAQVVWPEFAPVKIFGILKGLLVSEPSLR